MTDDREGSALPTQSGGRDFACSAGNGHVPEVDQGGYPRAGKPQKLRYPHQKGQECNVAKCDSVAYGPKGLELQRGGIHVQHLSEMGSKLCRRVMRNFDGGKLPHARKQDVIMEAGVAN